MPILREKLIKDKKFFCSKCNTAVYITRISGKKTGVIHKNETTPFSKGYICSINKIKYISIDERLPEEESIAQVRAAFAAAHVYLDSPPDKDLEYIRKWFIRWKQQ